MIHDFSNFCEKFQLLKVGFVRQVMLKVWLFRIGDSHQRLFNPQLPGSVYVYVFDELFSSFIYLLCACSLKL